MYIREDLLNKIKKVFNIKKFTYVGTEKHFYNDNDMFIFDCGNKNIAIEVETANFFYIYVYKTKKSSDYPGYSYTVTSRNFLLIKDNKIHLIVNGETTVFPRETFDCTSELVLLTMEKYV